MPVDKHSLLLLIFSCLSHIFSFCLEQLVIKKGQEAKIKRHHPSCTILLPLPPTGHLIQVTSNKQSIIIYHCISAGDIFGISWVHFSSHCVLTTPVSPFLLRRLLIFSSALYSSVPILARPVFGRARHFVPCCCHFVTPSSLFCCASLCYAYLITSWDTIYKGLRLQLYTSDQNTFAFVYTFYI